MHRQQRGVTLIGWLFLLVPLAIVGYGGIRLAPIYLNYTKVVRSMDQIAQEIRADDSATAVRNALDKRLDIESIEFPEGKDFILSRDGQIWVLQADYEDTAPLFANISLVVKFDKTVRFNKTGE